MNRIIKHIPNFCSGVDKEEYTFNSLDEFYNTPLIQHTLNWTDKLFRGVYFKKFKVVPYINRFLLECYYTQDGKEQRFVVGFLDSNLYLEDLQ